MLLLIVNLQEKTHLFLLLLPICPCPTRRQWETIVIPTCGREALTPHPSRPMRYSRQYYLALWMARFNFCPMHFRPSVLYRDMEISENGETVRGVLVHYTSESISPPSVQIIISYNDSSGVLS